MIQSMMFRENQSNFNVDKANTNWCKISFWTGAENSYGSVHMSSYELRELRKWITRQIRELDKIENKQ